VTDPGITAPPTRPALGGATLNRDYFMDVALLPTDVDDDATPDEILAAANWLPFMGLTDFTPHFATQTTQDTSDFDGGGYKDTDVTALAWGAEGKLLRKTRATDPRAYDPGQELVRKHGFLMGSAAPILVRIYEYADGGPREEAVAGQAVVGVDWDGGGMDATKSVSWTASGKGKPYSTAHPFPYAAAAGGAG
jgi:hypothetical protein